LLLHRGAQPACCAGRAVERFVALVVVFVIFVAEIVIRSRS
jgi:hypothetical protein